MGSGDPRGPELLRYSMERGCILLDEEMGGKWGNVHKKRRNWKDGFQE